MAEQTGSPCVTGPLPVLAIDPGDGIVGQPSSRGEVGLCLARTGLTEKADRVLRDAIDLAPYTSVAELCMTALRKMAHDAMRANVGDGLRMDVVMYCLSALRKMRAVGVERFQSITLGIALLGRNGLDINDPTSKYTLKSLPGQFSGMLLVSCMYVGFKCFAPDHDAGIDLAKEYEAARQLFDGKQPH